MKCYPSSHGAKIFSRQFGSRAAFTLIELLTVIAIIGILAAILIPTVASVRKKAKDQQCASNLREWGRAVQLFAADHKNTYFVRGDYWGAGVSSWPSGQYSPYLQLRGTESQRDFRACPMRDRERFSADSQVDYLMGYPRLSSGAAVPRDRIPVDKAKNPAMLLTFFDRDPVIALGNAWVRTKAEMITNTTGLFVAPGDRHGSKINAVFLDGHLDKIEMGVATETSNRYSIQAMGDIWTVLDS